MNFCGGNQQTLFDNTTETTTIPMNADILPTVNATATVASIQHTFHCVGTGCVRDLVLNENEANDYDEDDAFLNVDDMLSPISSTLSSSNNNVDISTNDNATTTSISRGDIVVNSDNVGGITTSKPVGLARKALDNIQQTIEEMEERDALVVTDIMNVDDLFVEDDDVQDENCTTNIHVTTDNKVGETIIIIDQEDDDTEDVEVDDEDYDMDINAVQYTPLSSRNSNNNLSSPCLLNPLDENTAATTARSYRLRQRIATWETREGIEIDNDSYRMLSPRYHQLSQQHQRPQELLCPILFDNLHHQSINSPSQEAVLQQFEFGFSVRSLPLQNESTIESAVTATTNSDCNKNILLLSLHPDRTRICLKQNNNSNYINSSSATNSIPRRQPHTSHFWYPTRIKHFNNNSMSKSNSSSIEEILISNILRLEIGCSHIKGPNSTGIISSSSASTFSIITNTDSSVERKHTFEASSVIDREVIVSTLLLLLDQIHYQSDSDHNTLIHAPSDTNIDTSGNECNGGGTMDKPIPCSPSLDGEDEEDDDELPIISCSPSLETERIQNSYNHFRSSNRNNQQALGIRTGSTLLSMTSTEINELENGDVIHLEDLSISESNVSRVLGQWSRRTNSSSICLTQNDGSEEVEDIIRLDCKASTSSTQVFGGSVGTATGSSSNNNNTNSITQNVWCSGDTCALALNDIADTCTGIFALKHNESICSPTLGTEQRVAVEEFIATALGTSNVVYSYLTEGGDIWNNTASAATIDAKEGTVHRNRASILNAQAARLRALRNEMTFAAALKQSKEKMNLVQTVQSFDDAYNRAGTKKLRAATEAANRLHTSPLFKSIVGNLKMHDANGNTKTDNSNSNESEDVVYYDSDPEDSRPRNADKGPRRIVQAKLHQNTNNRFEKITSDSSISSTPLASIEEYITPLKISRKLDEETIVEIVQTMNNERLTLMWHPTQKVDKNVILQQRSPQCVKVWIEAGVYLNDGTFLLPKLTWSKVSTLLSSSLTTSATTGVSSSSNVSLPQRLPRIQYSATLEKLDLLDICRIYPLTNVNRTLHPFALTQKSFCIETQSEKYVFQAQTIDEKERIVYGLKLVVARLASLLMLRDIRAAEEFFGALNSSNTNNATSNVVPGHPPSWATSTSTSTQGAASSPLQPSSSPDEERIPAPPVEVDPVTAETTANKSPSNHVKGMEQQMTEEHYRNESNKKYPIVVVEATNE